MLFFGLRSASGLGKHMRNSEKPLAHAHLNIAATALAHSRKPSVAPVAALVAAFVAVQNDFASLQLSIRRSKSIQGQLSRKKISVSSWWYLHPGKFLVQYFGSIGWN